MDGLTSVERFYRRLLELDSTCDLSACVADALCLLTEITGARFAIVELFDGNPFEDVARRRFRTPRPANDGLICHEVVRAALEDRATINIAAATLHHRFRESTTATTDAVLCVPVGAALPAGVLYVQGRAVPGRFPEEDRQRAELLAARLRLVSRRLLEGPRKASMLDAELRWFSQSMVYACLERNGGNVSRVAQQMGITRARVYRILKETLPEDIHILIQR